MGKHAVEKRIKIQEKVNSWLNNNPAEMQLLMWDFREELKDNLKFKYKPSQFRCWVWDSVINKKEK